MRLGVKVAAALGLGMLVLPRPTVAAPLRVRLVRPASDNPLVREITARTAGEVVAAGFSVELQELSSTSGAPDPSFATDVAASIAIGPLGDGDDCTIEVTINRRQIYRATIARREVSAADGARVLAAAAIHAVAALETALLARPERSASSSAAPASPPTLARRGPIPSRPGRFGAGLGMAVLQSLQGLAPMWAPTVRLSCRVGPPVALGLRILALGTSISAVAPAGTARVGQDLAFADVAIGPRPEGRFHPVLVGGAGVYHMSVDGTGLSPFVGRSDHFWGAAAALGLGLQVDFSARLALTLESQAVMIWPQPTVQIDTVEVGRAGRPSLAHTAGLLFRL